MVLIGLCLAACGFFSLSLVVLYTPILSLLSLGNLATGAQFGPLGLRTRWNVGSSSVYCFYCGFSFFQSHFSFGLEKSLHDSCLLFWSESFSTQYVVDIVRNIIRVVIWIFCSKHGETPFCTWIDERLLLDRSNGFHRILVLFRHCYTLGLTWVDI